MFKEKKDQVNFALKSIEENKSKPYLDNCYKRMKNGEIDIISGLYDIEINRELMRSYLCQK